MVKAKRKTERGKGNDGALETLLRFEIIVVLFSLIGLYYFLSFSPIRMPVKPIASPPQTIAPLPPQPESQVDSGSEIGKPVTVSGTAQVAVVAVSAQAHSLAASVQVANSEVEAPSEDLSPVSGSDISSVSAEKLNSSDPAVSESAELLQAQVSAVPPVSETNGGLPPVTVVSQQESPAVRLIAKPESPQKSVPAASVKSVEPAPLIPRTIVAGEYVLQVDFLKNKERLEALDFKVKSEISRRPTSMYRVYLGTFPQQKKALEAMAVVRKKGDEPFLQACSGGYNVVIGSFYLHSSVVAWENMYHASGFEPKVQKVTLKMPHTVLLLDGPKVQQDPETVLERLQTAGFSNSHLR